MNVDEVKADAIRAAFRGAREAGIRLDTATTEGETWTRTRLQRAATIGGEFRTQMGDPFVTASLTVLLRDDAEAMGAVALDEEPEFTWTPLRDDMTPDHLGLTRDPRWWVMTASQPVAVPEGHPALLLDEEET